MISLEAIKEEDEEEELEGAEDVDVETDDPTNGETRPSRSAKTEKGQQSPGLSKYLLKKLAKRQADEEDQEEEEGEERGAASSRSNGNKRAKLMPPTRAVRIVTQPAPSPVPSPSSSLRCKHDVIL